MKAARSAGPTSGGPTRPALRSSPASGVRSGPESWRRWQQLAEATPRSAPRPRRRPAEPRQGWLRWALVGFGVGAGGAALSTLVLAARAGLLTAWVGALPAWPSLRGIAERVEGFAASVRAAEQEDPTQHGRTSNAPAEPAPVDVSRAAAALLPARNGSGKPALLGAPEPAQVLIATGYETYVYASPALDARRLGYLRRGRSVARGAAPVGFDGCEQGFYAVEPEGYVCAGPSATLDPEHPVARDLGRSADRTSALPYRYGTSRLPPPPLYTRLPGYDGRERVEPNLDEHVRSDGPSPWVRWSTDPVPSPLMGGGWVPRYDGEPAPSELSAGRALARSSFAFAALFKSDGYEYGLTTDAEVVPLDRVTPAEPSAFRGVALGEGQRLPVAFARTGKAFLYTRHPRDPRFQVKRRLKPREPLALSGQVVTIDQTHFLETVWGDWVNRERVIEVRPLAKLPSWATPGRAWIDVALDPRTLVAYVGERPVYATLIAAGDDVSIDAERRRALEGLFVIHTKHVTRTLEGGAGADLYERRDAPYVQVFDQGLSLFGVYWHERFGASAREPGIGLAPEDARWLFEWTEPAVPEHWHGRYGSDGTLIHVHR